jgi:MYXO-CTERM domain-containing protein
MKLQKIVAAVALLAAGAANAAVAQFDGVSTIGNGSLIMVMADTTGTTTQGLTVDLGFNYSDFANGGIFSQRNQTVVWDFAANTISVNRSILGGMTNDWADQYGIFAANSDAAETKWAVISGAQKGTMPSGYLTTGQPTAVQLTQQTPAVTANMVAVTNPLLKNARAKGTIATADNGAYAMGSTDTAYVGTAYSLTSIKGWKNNIKWDTWSVDGARTNFYQVNANGSEAVIYNGVAEGGVDAGLLNGFGTFSKTGTTLVWTTAVPEPESYALALVGLAAAGFVARRRAAK